MIADTIDRITKIIAEDVCGRCNSKSRWAITTADRAAEAVVCGDHHDRCHAAFRAQAEAICQQIVRPMDAENAVFRIRAEQAEARVARLEEALRFYAREGHIFGEATYWVEPEGDRRGWVYPNGDANVARMGVENGRIGRAALAGEE